MRPAETLFVSIASYRDPELIPTLKDMIANAAHPEALHIAICWQHDEDISLFIDAGMTLCQSYIHSNNNIFVFEYQSARITILSIHYYHSHGACWARHKAEQFYNDETWFLQIDSHCRFIHHWDSEAIAMMKSLQKRCPKPILSTYPPSYNPADEANRSAFISRLTFREFSPEGLPMLSSTTFNADEPPRCGYLAGGLIFAPGSFVLEVPNDPEIFFAGEEIAMAARAFTHGYDIHTPNKILLWHFYQRSDANKIWGDHNNKAKENGSVDLAWWERDKVSKKRVRSLLGLESSPSEPGAYGHGKARTLAEFERRIGVHFCSQTVMPDVVGDARLSYFPDRSYSESDWLEKRIHPNHKKIQFSKDEISHHHADIHRWHFGAYCANNVLLKKIILTPEELEKCFVSQKGIYEIAFSFTSPPSVKPSVIRGCPFHRQQGWGEVVEKKW
ncbi:GlcNAc-transferase family protein [Siccibacter turicensis]|uniref:GlcNAc-transferase family protein n=1 Tax=Siccibacter turicensis TaxID=357233 RepID=UPI002A6B6410|nr:GlcNAc-transferase family protein [Siccibacter turicensis]MDY0969878.1 GlcNAc-transferase family protein [Siccibacter turicensis]